MKAVGLMALAAVGLFLARPTLADLTQSDAVMRQALGDELQRTLVQLSLPAQAKPHFASYTVLDADVYLATATHGAIILESRAPMRSLLVSLRVGTPQLDSSNAGFTGAFMGSSFGGAPLDDNYAALRRDLWLSSDADYKRAIEALAQKQSALSVRVNNLADSYPDFSAEPRHTTVALGPTLNLDQAKAELRRGIERLSLIFSKDEKVLDSGASVQCATMRRRLLNSEQTWADEEQVVTQLQVYASTQADDGMPLQMNLDFTGTTPSTMPAFATVETKTREALAQLGTLRSAPVADSGTAVILFEGRASAQLVQALLAERLSGSPPLRYMGAENDTSLAPKLGLVVISPLLDVFDDPTMKAGPHGEPLWGSYSADDEGVPARKVSLIERGVLKTLLMSRAPRKEIRESNGHYRLQRGAAIGNLVVKSNKPQSRQRLLQLAEAEAKKLGPGTKVYIVRRLAALYDLGALSGRMGVRFDPPLSPEQGVAASEAYVLADGVEQPVRGLLIERIDLRAMKALVAAGGDSYVLNQNQIMGLSITAPPLLFADMDVKRHEIENPKPPSYPAP